MRRPVAEARRSRGHSESLRGRRMLGPRSRQSAAANYLSIDWHPGDRRHFDALATAGAEYVQSAVANKRWEQSLLQTRFIR